MHIATPVALLACLWSGLAAAEEAPPPPPPQAPAPYSLPFQLRPVRPASSIRLDSVLAAANDAVTEVSFLSLGVKATPQLVPIVRIGFVVNSPSGAPVQTSVTNPLIGASYAIPLPDGFTVTPFLGLTLPVGSGGGNEPDADAAAANRAGISARSAMDNAMFAVNDLAIIPGVGVAWVGHRFTVQLELTLLQLLRVRGEDRQPDAAKTNFTSALHVGYFIVPQLSAGAELRFQSFLSTPAAVAADPTGASRDTWTVALGVRAHFLIGTMWFRPGLAYARGLDDPMSGRDVHVIQLDLPVVF